MRKIYLLLLGITFYSPAFTQITITASDMPVNGDTLRYSYTATTTSISLSATGAGFTWDFSSLSPVGQRVDNYKTALLINPLYAIISPNAYGYKVADSFPGLGAFLPVSIKDIYTFYSKKPIVNPTRFVAEGFAASISGLPTPAVYQDEDEMYFFPLEYGVTNDSSTFRLKFDLLTLGSMVQKGYRKTTVDGWGTIITPYFTNPLSCIRVRSEIHEVDSISIPPLPAIGIPRNTVEYKWLANAEHYPAMWVTANLTGSTETVTSVRYRDMYRSGLLGIETATKGIATIIVYPNPAIGSTITIDIPESWKDYIVQVYNIVGQEVLHVENSSNLNVSNISSGKYLVTVHTDSETGYAWFEK